MACSFSPLFWQQPWGLQLAGTPQAAKLATGELLLQFAVAWPAGAGSWRVYLGAGMYSGGGVTMFQRHPAYPQSHTVLPNGTINL